MIPLLPAPCLAALLLVGPQDGKAVPEPGAGEETSGGAKTEALLEALKDDDFFAVEDPAAPGAMTAKTAERNPFLLQVEQATGLPYDALRAEQDAEEQRRRQLELLERRAREQEDLDLTLGRALVEKLSVSAVLVAGDGGTAIIDGHLVDEKEKVPGTDLVLTRVHRGGVTLSLRAQAFDLFLPPPKSRKSMPDGSSPDQGKGDAPPQAPSDALLDAAARALSLIPPAPPAAPEKTGPDASGAESEPAPGAKKEG
jgi:hypothetical protein